MSRLLSFLANWVLAYSCAYSSTFSDDAIFYIDSDIDEVVEEASEPTDKATELQAEGPHEELLNELVFASIPPILSGLVDYLRSSGFLRNIQ